MIIFCFTLFYTSVFYPRKFIRNFGCFSACVFKNWAVAFPFRTRFHGLFREFRQAGKSSVTCSAAERPCRRRLSPSCGPRAFRCRGAKRTSSARWRLWRLSTVRPTYRASWPCRRGRTRVSRRIRSRVRRLRTPAFARTVHR